MPRKLTGRIEERPTVKKRPPGTPPERLVVRIGRENVDSFTVAHYASYEAALADAKECLKLALGDRSTFAHKRSFAVQFTRYMDEEREGQQSRRGNTRQWDRNERSLARLYIETAPFWRKRVDDVNRGEVRALVKSIAGRPALRWCKRAKKHVATGKKIGQRTCEAVRSRLTSFFDWVPDLADNVAKGVPLPKVRGIKRREAGSDVKPHLHVDEIDRLFGLELDKLTAMHRAVYAFGIYAGLRGGEVLGLEWSHLRRLYGDEPEIWVRNSYDSETKTELSQREIPMLPQLVAHVQAYVASLPVRPVTGYVFPGRDGGVRCDGWAAGWYEVDRGPRKAGGRYVSPGFRELAGVREDILYRHVRHTFATHMLKGSFGHVWPLELVSQWLGHSSTAITIKHYVSRDVARLHAEVAKAHSKAQTTF